MRKTLICKNCKNPTHRYDEQCEWNDIKCPICGHTSDDSNVQGWADKAIYSFDQDINDTDPLILESIAEGLDVEETSLLIEAVDDFSDKMKQRLLEKQKEGFFGWNERENLEEIARRLLDKVHGTVKNIQEEDPYTRDMIDVANFSMMLSYITENGQ